MNGLQIRKFLWITGLALTASLSWCLSVQAALKTRIAVLPIYTEEGTEVNPGGEAALHYRRIMGFINRELVKADFEVVNPFAGDAAEKELNRTLERAREDSPLVSGELCHRYGLDAVIVVKMDVGVRTTQDGYIKALCQLFMDGYDSAGRDLGIADDREMIITKRDRDRAVRTAEKELGSLVGRLLTDWEPHLRRAAGANGRAKGGLATHIRAQDRYLDLTLHEATEEEVVEVFGKVVNTVQGVVDAKITAQEIIPGEPQRCFTRWRVEIRGTDTFRLKTNINKMISDILDAGGSIRINGVPYRYTSPEVRMLMGFRSGRVTANAVHFVIDRDRARARSLSGRHDSYDRNRQSNVGFD